LFSQQSNPIDTLHTWGLGEIKTVISHTEIEKNGAKSLSQLLNEQAGFVINGAYQTAGSFINIYSEGALGAKTLILIDGLPVWDPSSISDAYFDLNFISLNEIEQIILYKTAQSVSFGSGAMCGAINIITRKNKSSKAINLKVSQGIGNLNASSAAIQFWGSKRQFNYQLSYSTSRNGGFSYATDTTGTQGFDKDGYHNNIFNSRIEYNPQKNLSFYSYCLFSHYKASTDIEGFVDTKDYYYTNKFLNTGIGGRFSKNNTSITFDFKGSNAIRDYHNAPLNTEHFGGLTHFGKLELFTKLSQHISFSVGTDYRYNQLTNTAFDTVNGAITLHFPTSYQYDLFGGIHFLNNDSTFSLNLKGRMNKHSLSGVDNTFSVDGGFRINKFLNLFTSVSSGFLTPSLFESTDTFLGNKSLGSEKTTSYNLGIELKNKFLWGRLSIQNNRINHIINYNFNTNAYANCDKLTATMVEYEFKTQLNHSIVFSGNYTFLVGKEQTISRQNFTDTTTYDYLVRRPKNIGNLNITYNNKKKLSITLNGRFVSKYYEVGLGSNDCLMNGFLILNLNSFIYLYRGLSVNIGIQNLLNKTFFDTRGFNSIPLLINGCLSYTF